MSRTAMHPTPITTLTVAGKAILLGEHFVVYGTPAIAASIPDAVIMNLCPGDALCLDIPQWALHIVPDRHGNDIARAFAALVEQLPAVDPVRLNARIALPSGVGLGSSASLGVAVLNALCAHEGWDLTGEERFQLVFAWERVFHGEPSGFDHAAAMHRGLTRFERFADPPIRSLNLDRPLHLLIAQIADGANTKQMVDGVREWRNTHPTQFEDLCEQATARAKSFVACLADPAPSNSTSCWRRIGDLLSENQRDLRTIGVSTPLLDAACERAESAGAFGAKLIGAGGGGCMLALVSPSTERAVKNALDELSRHTFPLYLADGTAE